MAEIFRFNIQKHKAFYLFRSIFLLIETPELFTDIKRFVVLAANSPVFSKIGILILKNVFFFRFHSF
ncbi:hypothetical protein [Leptospira weilii]|uniref:Uncharacterized protein n=1 Tax=Leptospira weilii str. UI 13098 TaxID=1088542 RepID=M6QAA8_9LEPT|nr:hypothetical protein [Leptospira weilii]EMN92254.1 hypothetical protein LEP1GSC108_4564 [Leptospira weilii str. UI 13098]